MNNVTWRDQDVVMTTASSSDVQLEVVDNYLYCLPRSGSDRPPTVGLHVVATRIVWTSQVDRIMPANVDCFNRVVDASIMDVTNCLRFTMLPFSL